MARMVTDSLYYGLARFDVCIQLMHLGIYEPNTRNCGVYSCLGHCDDSVLYLSFGPFYAEVTARSAGDSWV